jgi:hypothetical protein
MLAAWCTWWTYCRLHVALKILLSIIVFYTPEWVGERGGLQVVWSLYWRTKGGWHGWKLRTGVTVLILHISLREFHRKLLKTNFFKNHSIPQNSKVSGEKSVFIVSSLNLHSAQTNAVGRLLVTPCPLGIRIFSSLILLGWVHVLMFRIYCNLRFLQEESI